jgi:hypothetical protein
MATCHLYDQKKICTSNSSGIESAKSNIHQGNCFSDVGFQVFRADEILQGSVPHHRDRDMGKSQNTTGVTFLLYLLVVCFLLQAVSIGWQRLLVEELPNGYD